MDPLHSILTALMSELDVYQRCSPLPLLSVISLLPSLLASSESQALPLTSDMGKGTLETFFGSAQKGFPPRSPAPVAPSRSHLSSGARQPLQVISNNVPKRKRADISTDTIDLTISDEEDAEPSRINALGPKATSPPLPPPRIAHSRYYLPGGRQRLQAITSRVRNYNRTNSDDEDTGLSEIERLDSAKLPTRSNILPPLGTPGGRPPLQIISPNVPRKRRIMDFMDSDDIDQEDDNIQDENMLLPSQSDASANAAIEILHIPPGHGGLRAEVEIERLDSDTLAFKPITLVICIARLSSAQSEEKEQYLHINNRKLYDKFQKDHGLVHMCSEDDCPAEFQSIVFNGMSSNTDITKSHGLAMRRFRRYLQDYKVQDETSGLLNSAVIIFSRQDGFITNVEAFKSFFQSYSSHTIYLLMYQGMSDSAVYPLREMLITIELREAGHTIKTPCYELHMDWVRVSLNKEGMAQLQRDNKKVMAGYRNVVDDGDHSVQSSADTNTKQIIVMSADNSSRRRQETIEIIANKAGSKNYRVQRYDLEVQDDRLLCPIDGCKVQFEDHDSGFSKLVSHVFDHCKSAKACLLCPDHREWAGGLVDRPNGKKHIQSHLPPTKPCPVEGCTYMTRTSAALFNHKRSHGLTEPAPKTYVCDEHMVAYIREKQMILHRAVQHGEGTRERLFMCEACGGAYPDERGLTLHQRDHCRVLRAQSNVEYQYPCEICDEVFSTYSGMASHRYKIHVRREQVVGWPVRAGVVNASDIVRSGSEIV